MSKEARSEQKKVYAAAVLCVVAAVMAYVRFVRPAREDGAPPGGTVAETPYQLPDLPKWIEGPLAPADDGPKPYRPPSRDLFARGVETGPDGAPGGTPRHREPARPRLQGIMRGANDTRAMVDGRIVTTGDTVGAYKVLAILPREVILESPEGRLVLTVGE